MSAGMSDGAVVQVLALGRSCDVAGRRRLAVRAALVAVAVAVVAPACSSGGSERSTASFCSTMRSEKQRIRGQLDDAAAAQEAAGDDFAMVLIGLGGSIQAIGELRTYFRKLAAVAPDEIRTEAEIVAESYDKQLDSAGDAVGDPLGGLGGLLMSSLTTSGQMNALDEFAFANCGEHL